ncbi:MAG: TlpA disulfide reductase family protein, partial [Bacteroidota bacterium]
MKRLLISLQLLYLPICLFGQTRIVGNFNSMEDWSNAVYLLAITDYKEVFSSTNRYHIDTAVVDQEGNFEFQLDELPCTACLYRIDVRPKGSNGPMVFGGTSKENFALFELKNGQHLKIDGNADQLTKSFSVKGGSQNWTYEKIRQLREPIYELGDTLNSQFMDAEFLSGKNLDSLREDGLQRLKVVIEQNNKELLQLMKESTNVYDKIIGGYLYDYDRNMENDLSVYEMVRDELQDTYGDHPYQIQLKKAIYETKYVLPAGSVAPSLTLPDVEGKETDLYEVGTNLILVDFWASWCSPCRHENRVTVKPLYDEFKEKGFVVYSVSMDDKKERWTAAIEKDEMSWNNVSDLLGMQSPIYSLYKIDALPTTYLVE